MISFACGMFLVAILNVIALVMGMGLPERWKDATAAGFIVSVVSGIVAIALYIAGMLQ